MDRFARNALRLALAGAGIAVLGAGVVGQASADEDPTGPAAQLPDNSEVADNYQPQGQDSADFTDAQDSASPFGQYPGGGTLLPLQTVPAPQDALATENLTQFLIPDGPQAQSN